MMLLRDRPFSLWMLLLLLGQLSVRAFAGGVALLIVPSGSLVGLPTGPLENTPFGDFFVPGLLLLLTFGIVPAVVCYGLLLKRRWAWPGALIVALTLLLWIAVEYVVGFHRMTIYLNLGTALGIAWVALMSGVRPEFQGYRQL